MLHDGVQAIPKVENGDLFVSEHHHHIQLPHVLGSHGARHLNTLAGYGSHVSMSEKRRC